MPLHSKVMAHQVGAFLETFQKIKEPLMDMNSFFNDMQSKINQAIDVRENGFRRNANDGDFGFHLPLATCALRTTGSSANCWTRETSPV